MSEEFSLEDAIIVLKRRIWLFILPLLAVLVIGAVVVMLLPAKYSAQGVILVESAQIPSEMVRSTINTYAQERIQMIRQHVMTRNRLVEVADKYEVFPRELGYSESRRARIMRTRLDVALIRAEGARTSAQRDGTIAFTVSYTDQNPDKAFQIANEFISLFLTEDVRTRTTGAANTTEFFKQEAARLKTQVDALDSAIARYKSENSKSLPEHLDMHIAMHERAGRELSALETSIAATEDELRFLEMQLLSYLAGAGFDDGPIKEIAKLRSELAQLRSVYHDSHPSVQGVRSQIAALERELAPSRQFRELQQSVSKAETDLRNAERELESDDPALEVLRQALTNARERLSGSVQQAAQAGGGDIFSAQIQSRISTSTNRRNALESQRDELRAQMSDLQERIARTPEVERGLQGLMREYANFEAQFKEVQANQNRAALAESLEDNQKAEKFSILEPATRPDRPSSPERGKLLVLVLFAAIGAGGAAVLAAEVLNSTVRGSGHISKLVEQHPIAVIPYISAGNERRWLPPFLRPRAVGASAAAAAVAVAVVAQGDINVSRPDASGADLHEA